MAPTDTVGEALNLLPKRAHGAVIVVEDCVDTMDGPALHEAGLACIRTAFGHVMKTDSVMALERLAPRKPNAA